MKEQIITFETSKLLRDKGCDIKQNIFNNVQYYNYLGELNGDQTDYLRARIRKEDTDPFNIYVAPSQSLVQKWLREAHNIGVFCLPKTLYPDNAIYLNGEYHIFIIENNREHCEYDGVYLGYENALEVAIQEGLKLIK